MTASFDDFLSSINDQVKERKAPVTFEQRQEAHVIVEAPHTPYEEVDDIDPNQEIKASCDTKTMLKIARRKLLLNLMKQDVIDEADLKSRAFAFQTVNNAARLEMGKSTENHAHAVTGTLVHVDLSKVK